MIRNPYLYIQFRTKFPSPVPAVYADKLKHMNDDLRKIFIQNIPLDTSNDELYEFLEGFGYTQKCEIAFNKFTREPKYFGFARLDKNAAEYLIQNYSRIPFKGTLLHFRYDTEEAEKPKWGGIPDYRPFTKEPADKHEWKNRARSWEQKYNNNKK
ncbi:hypothetical protein HDV01_000199 [Terramyces sp. JEL0728]|nr:hypothetical protein HDV01_000199 [Terramyces sp. JEL0728]